MPSVLPYICSITKLNLFSMKKITTLAAIAAFGLSSLMAQTQRVILYEEFTGENCPPCASSNPYIDQTINPSFPGQILLLRYQTNIPTAPGAGSLYADNSTESNARKSYYAVNSAPSALFNGFELPDPQGTNDGHAILIHNSYYPGIIPDSAIVNAPFGLSITHSLNATADSLTISATVTAAMSYTASTLVVHLALSESEIYFTTPPGTNGETDFFHVMRKMVPGSNGTALDTVWAASQSQTVTHKIKIPTYIKDKAKMEIIGWVQENATKRVHNAGYSAPQKLADDAAATAISGLPGIACATSVNPVATITNAGANTITTCTVTYQLDAQTPSTTTFTGSIASGATATVAIPAVSVTSGTHTLTVSTSMPNGTSDLNPNNDSKKQTFTIIGTAVNAPIVEPFTSTTYPPANWTRIDLSADNIGWSRMTASGSSSGGGASRMYFYLSPAGAIDELYLPYNNLGSSSQLTFYVAGAPYTASTPENDVLEFMISTDCGSTWSTLYSKSGTTLYTAGGTTSSFTPSSASQWRMETVSLSAYDSQSNLLMKFRATSDYGNNVWVDDVNLTTVTGIETQSSNVLFSTVYPNPASSNTQVTVTLAQPELVSVNVLNTLGEVVIASSHDMKPGDNRVSLNTGNLASGMYHVLISTAQGSVTHKLTVSK